LVPKNFRRYVKTGHHLSLGNKDTEIKAISYWITELGELDSTFKQSDISKLKAFTRKTDDVIRLPY
ncbi:MAG: virulence-associated E family protein, partial [Methylococcus sp.]